MTHQSPANEVQDVCHEGLATMAVDSQPPGRVLLFLLSEEAVTIAPDDVLKTRTCDDREGDEFRVREGDDGDVRMVASSDDDKSSVPHGNPVHLLVLEAPGVLPFQADAWRVKLLDPL